MTRRPNQEARGRILEAAQRLFGRGGFEAVSMDKVAEAAGLKKANLFHYYPTKEALGVAVVEEAARRQSQGVLALFADATQDPLTATRELFERGSAGMRGDGPRCCFIGRMAQEVDERNDAMRRRLTRCLGEWRDGLARFLGAWKKKGYFKPGFKPEEAADGVLALYEGGLLLAKATGRTDAVDNARRAAETILRAWKS
jgi:TetR/AcrR family transcriptional regulator, transcriptional repressor for nem operon